MKLPATIEAVLFYKGEPVSIPDLMKLLEKNREDINLGLDELDIGLKERGLTLVRGDNEVCLGTKSEFSDLIEKIHKEESEFDEPTKPALETLSVILYRGPVSKTDIDYLRGVNSYFTLRHLTTRGLVEKIPDPRGSGGHLYKPTLELLSTLGVGKSGELPNYSNLNAALK